MRPLSRSAMKMVRDGFGKFEDKFFSSVFIGSGLVFLAMMFVSSAVGAGLVASSPVIDATNGSAVATFGTMMLLALFPGVVCDHSLGRAVVCWEKENPSSLGMDGSRGFAGAWWSPAPETGQRHLRASIRVTRLGGFE